MIVAVDRMGGYAHGRKIPWSFEADQKHFKKITNGTVCIMGRTTYDDLANQRKEKHPNFQDILPGRDSYVVSTTRSKVQGATVYPSVGQVINNLPDDDREIYLLGGRRMWVEYITTAKQIWMTIVPGKHTTNKKFPFELLTDYEIVEGYKEPVGDDELMFVKYVRKVTYYTARLSIPEFLEKLVERLTITNRMIKKDNNSVTFVEPTDIEINFINRVGGILTARQGLAIE